MIANQQKCLPCEGNIWNAFGITNESCGMMQVTCSFWSQRCSSNDWFVWNNPKIIFNIEVNSRLSQSFFLSANWNSMAKIKFVVKTI